ncbi:hypothetical protein Tco_1324471, partial [Tanacetum coccineum]
MGKNTGQREIRPVWNNVQRINHQNKFVPSAVLTRSGRVPVSTAKKSSLRATASTSTFRPVNTATHTNRVNVSKLRTNAFHKSHSPIRRPFHKSTTPNIRISNEKVNTVRVNGVNTAGQTAVSAVKGNGVTAVKASAGCVWRPKMTNLNNVSKDNSGSWVSKRGNPQQALKNKGIFNSGCSRHMTGNKDFLIDYQDIDGGFVAFGGSARGASTPLETNKALTKDEDGEDVDIYLYRSMIGSLMYHTSSKPDITFLVCAYSRFQVQPKVSHLNAVKRIFRYLKGQPKLGLWYPKDSPSILEAFSDNDYAGASLDRKSTTGGCQFLGSRLISWQCKKQTVVANSTTEVEYIAASHCCGQVLWIQNQMLDYGYNFMQTKIHVDNESAICVVKNPVYHSKTKHIEIRHHFIRDSYEKRLIEMVKIHTDNNVADLLTKAFDGRLMVYKYSGLYTSTNWIEVGRWQSQAPRHHGGAPAQTRSKRVLKKPNEPPLSEGHTSGSGKGRMEYQFKLTANVPISPYDSPLPGGYTPRSDDGRLQLHELMTMCTKLSKQVLDLEKEEDAQAVEILRLMKYRQFESLDDDLDEEDASKQGRGSDKIKPILCNFTLCLWT